MTTNIITPIQESLQEAWKAIPGLEGYQASTLGRIRSLDRPIEFLTRWGIKASRLHKGRIIAPRPNGKGYFRISANKHKDYYIHRLIALTFHGEPPSKDHEAAHKDGDKSNNKPGNVMWATGLENMSHKVIHGTSGKGEKNTMAKLDPHQVLDIIKQYAHGVSAHQIAVQFNICCGTVYSIIQERIWKHLSSPHREKAKLQAKINHNRAVHSKKTRRINAA